MNDLKGYSENMTQDKFIETSIIGIAVNAAITILKINIGLLTNSPTIISDGLNNITSIISSVCDVIGHRMDSNPNPQIYNQLSDFSSILISVMPLLGAKWARKNPDKNHPYGYGRVEYMTSMLVSVAALLVALMSLYGLESLFTKPATHYSYTFLTIIATTIIAKIALAAYFLIVSKSREIPALLDSAKGELFDAGISFATVISALISMNWGISIDGVVTLIIVMVIIKASWDMMKANFDKLIGERTSPQLSFEIKRTIMEVPKVKGAYNLIMHDYGSKMRVGEVHIMVDRDMSATEIHALSRAVSAKVYEEFSIELAVGIYAEESREIRDSLYEIASKYEGMAEVVNITVNENDHLVIFDIIVPWDVDREEVKNMIFDDFKKEHPEFDYIGIDDYGV